jgi:RNA ligase (TIGR02306 family)
MAHWKVIADRVEILPHPNADSLALAKVGPFQLVVATANGYRSGDIVVFAPERSVLPDEIKGQYVNSETGLSYLSGLEANRVKRVRLRGEFSEGVTLDPAWVMQRLGVSSMAALPLDEDLSAALGITRYEPPIPASMAGEITPLDIMTPWHEHDVEQFRLYAAEFHDGEEVIATEKIHGSQGVFLRTDDGRIFATSKGFARNRQAIVENAGNLYWRAARATRLFERIEDTPGLRGTAVQVFAEVFPCQGAAFMYGATAPALRTYRVFVDGTELNVDAVREDLPLLHELWVPVLYRGPYDLPALVALAAGKEQVSGTQANMREGLVVAPAVPRRSREGFALFLKIINPKYKDSDEFVS